jgi:hypothetical protein
MLGEKEAQLEFWLRMGFEEMSSSTTNPLLKLATVPCPADLAAAAKSISDMGSIQSSVARGKLLATSKAGGPVKPMDEHKYGAIVLYTGNSIYRELNEALRVKHGSKSQKYEPTVSKARTYSLKVRTYSLKSKILQSQKYGPTVSKARTSSLKSTNLQSQTYEPTVSKALSTVSTVPTYSLKYEPKLSKVRTYSLKSTNLHSESTSLQSSKHSLQSQKYESALYRDFV